MNDFEDLHRPTPEFRTSLKRELRRALRAERQFGAPPAVFNRRLVTVAGIAAGAVISLTIGLVLGANTGPAAAEGLAASQREAAATSIATSRQFAASRLAIARATYDSIRRAFEAGQATKAQLDNAKAEVERMDANAAQVEVEAKSASAPARPSCLSLLMEAPVRNAITALSCGAAVATAQVPPQHASGIPIVNVTPALARTNGTFGAVLGLRELSDGRLLVNDAGRRQLEILDPSLATATVVLDSAAGTSSSYGPRPRQIVRYRSDSTLFIQGAMEPVLVLDGTGHVAHALALPTYEDGVVPFPMEFPPPRVMDDKGRLLALGPFQVRMNPQTHMGEVADSALILRADLESRKVEPVGVMHTTHGRNRSDPAENGKRVVTTIIQPVPTEDSWTVLSDGTIAFVRARDYHVDWVLPDGTKKSTDKLPFDWKRLTDEEKQKLADSAKVVWDSLMAIRNKRAAEPMPSGRGDAPGGEPQQGRGRSSGGAGEPGASRGGSVQHMVSVPLSEIPDYYPPIHPNSAIPDLDGNLWVLTTTTAQSLHGELVYDVLNPRRGLFERVRMPVGRSVAGFGKGGVVYLQAGDRSNGFTLERVKLQAAPQE
jgi:hypothetical protein